jgi:4-aminobutyrate aminotransferase-like enzyme
MMSRSDESNLSWLQRLLAIECQDATYPVSPDDGPLVFESARGSIVRDVEGREYMDLCAGFGALPLGHNSSVVRQVFARQVELDFPPIIHGMGDVYPSRAKIELIEELRSVLPDRLSRVALAITGGQAVELALKSAMLYTGNAGFIFFKQGYHGVDLGVLPVTSRRDFKTPFKKYLAESIAIEIPYGCDEKILREALINLRSSSAGFAGVVVEPVQGRAGVINPPENWLSMLAAMSHDAGGVLILDEILTGLGRRGKWTEAQSVEADLVCFGKALGGGMPLSACVGTEKVMSAWPKSTGEAIHTGTFFGHPLSCLVAVETLREMKRINVCKVAHETGAWFHENLLVATAGHPAIEEIRWGGGLMLAVQYDAKQGSGAGALAMDRLRGKGVIALASGHGGSCLSFTPALNISREVLAQTLSIFSSL